MRFLYRIQINRLKTLHIYGITMAQIFIKEKSYHTLLHLQIMKIRLLQNMVYPANCKELLWKLLQLVLLVVNIEMTFSK